MTPDPARKVPSQREAIETALAEKGYSKRGLAKKLSIETGKSRDAWKRTIDRAVAGKGLLPENAEPLAKALDLDPEMFTRPSRRHARVSWEESVEKRLAALERVVGEVEQELDEDEAQGP